MYIGSAHPSAMGAIWPGQTDGSAVNKLLAFGAVALGVMWLTSSGPFNARGRLFKKFKAVRKSHPKKSRAWALGYAEGRPW